MAEKRGKSAKNPAKKRNRFKRGQDDLDQLTEIERAQAKNPQAIHRITKSVRRLKNRLDRATGLEDIHEQFD